MKKVIFSIILYIVALNLANAQEVPYEIAKEKAKHIVHDFHTMMRTGVQRNFENGGILQAAKFCANKSSKLIEQFDNNLESGISIKRISLKNRNPDAYPQKDEIKILEAFDLLEKTSVYLPEIVQLKKENIYKVYFPATMSKKSCKQCHGMQQNMNKEVLGVFKTKYPNDKALGFKGGQVRGAVVVTVELKDQRKNYVKK